MTSNINDSIQSYLDYLAKVENVDFDIDAAALARQNETAKEFLANETTAALQNGNFGVTSTTTVYDNLLAAHSLDDLEFLLADTYSTALTITENWVDGSYVPLQVAFPSGGGFTIDQAISNLENATPQQPPIIANAGIPLGDLLIRDVKGLYDIYDSFTQAEWNEINQLQNNADIQGQRDWWHETPEREQFFLTLNAFRIIAQENTNSWTGEEFPPVFAELQSAKQTLLFRLRTFGRSVDYSPPDATDGDQFQYGDQPIPVTGSIKTSLTLQELQEGASRLLGPYFVDFLQNNTATDFTAPEQFFDAFVTYAQANPQQIDTSGQADPARYIISPLTGNTILQATFPDVRENVGFTFYNSVSQSYKDNLSATMVSLLFPDFVESLRVVDDWADLNLSETEIMELFQNTLTGYFNYLTSGTPASAEDFFVGWNNFIGPSILFGAGPNQDPETALLTTFQDVWTAFMGTGREAEFIEKLGALVSQTAASGNPFIPGMLVDDWFQQVSGLFFKEHCIVDPTSSVIEADFEFVDILLRIYDALVNMLGFLQTMAAAQVARQDFLSKYEGAYTNYISQIPTFTQADITNPIGDEGNSNNEKLDREYRQDMAGLNTKYTESLRGFRSGVEDLEKQQRTNVSQTNEATNQQANIATAILQQFSALLQSIWR